MSGIIPDKRIFFFGIILNKYLKPCIYAFV